MSPIERLRRIAQRALAGERLGEDSAWLAAAVARYEREAARGVTLDDAFGVATHAGCAPWWREEALARRDQALRELAGRFFGELCVSKQAEELRRLISRYATTTWLRTDRNLSEMPTGYSGTPRELLFRAFSACDGRLPSSGRWLIKILDPVEAARR
jgi:hypothetical protein